MTNADLSHRYLWQANAVDQLLADEQVTNPQSPGNVVWPLTDNLGTVRDLAVYNAQSGTTSVANHRTFDSFGNLKSSINPTTNQAAAVDCIFGYTGRPVSKATGLQNNLNRWYDPIVAGWISQDPKVFTAGTTNLYVYCGNNPTNGRDPTGLVIVVVQGHSFPKLEPAPAIWEAEFWTARGQSKVWQQIFAGADLCLASPIAFSKIISLGGPYRMIRIESSAAYGAHMHLLPKQGAELYIKARSYEEAVKQLPNSLRNNQEILAALKKMFGG